MILNLYLILFESEIIIFLSKSDWYWLMNIFTQFLVLDVGKVDDQSLQSIFLKVKSDCKSKRWPALGFQEVQLHSRELTYPIPRHFWRYFSFSQGWYLLVPWRVFQPQKRVPHNPKGHELCNAFSARCKRWWNMDLPHVPLLKLVPMRLGSWNLHCDFGGLLEHQSLRKSPPI